jgi:mono/diheme cytochrome c family protein
MRFSPIILSICLFTLPAAAQDVDAGRQTYDRHCAVCHGADARGNGPMAAILTLQPKDLTTLAATNGGVFPRARVMARIDGRDPLVAHGSPMPVFGGYFVGKGVVVKDEAGVMVMTSQPVADLVVWLESIQQ